MVGSVDVQLVRTEAPAVPATVPHGSDLVLMFERLAKDPAVDVEKLERLIAMQERIMRHNAKAAFDGAFAQMQAELPEIDERGQIVASGKVRSTYAKLEDIHVAIKPVLKAHGFAMRHRTEWPADKPHVIRVVGILSHEQGHSEESVFEAPMDRSEYRSDIQSMGSTVSYGRRYTTLDLLNLATRNADNDGQRSAPAQTSAPDGFEGWWDDLRALADEGIDQLTAFWQAEYKGAHKHFCAYVLNHHQREWLATKQRAERAQKAQAAR